MLLDREPFREKFVRLDLPLFINVVTRTEGRLGHLSSGVPRMQLSGKTLGMWRSASFCCIAS